MKLKYEFDTIEIDHELYAVPVGNGANDVAGLLKLNQSSKAIIELLKNDTTVNKMVDALSVQYTNGVEEIESFVCKVIKQLRELNMIDE